MAQTNVKDEVLFLIGIRKKIDLLNTNKSIVDGVFKKIINDLQTQYQISGEALELLDAMYDLKEPVKEVKEVKPSKPASTTVDPCSRGYSATPRGGC